MTLETWSLLIGVVLGLGVVVGWTARKINVGVTRFNEFIRDWRGEEATEGRDAVPGVMERLNKLDGELSHNGGKSMKDMVFRMEIRQDRLERKMEEAELTRQQNQAILLEAIRTVNTQKTEI